MKRFLAAILALAMFLSALAMAEGVPAPNDPGKEGITVASFDQDFLSYIHAQRTMLYLRFPSGRR